MTGIRQRHGRACRAKAKCDCPWEASVFLAREQKKLRKTFPNLTAARRGDSMRSGRHIAASYASRRE